MKQLRIIAVLLLVAFVCVLPAGAEDIKYKETELDIFSVKMLHPADWPMEVQANYCSFTSPKDEILQLIYAEDNPRDITLDELFTDYKSRLAKEAGMKIKSSKITEIGGVAAYYVTGSTDKKDYGHIVFMKDKKPCFLVLKTKKGELSTYEPILMKVQKSISFYKPKVKSE